MKFRLSIASLFLLFFVVLGVPFASAQSSTGTLEGTILDQHQHPVFNAMVTVVQLDTQRTLTIRTTRAGVYSFPGLDAGNYAVTVSAPSFDTEQTTGIIIDAGGEATRDFTLKPGTQNVSVTVYAQTTGLDQDTSSVGNAVSQQLLENIPLPDHSSLGLVTLNFQTV